MSCHHHEWMLFDPLANFVDIHISTISLYSAHINRQLISMGFSANRHGEYSLNRMSQKNTPFQRMSANLRIFAQLSTVLLLFALSIPNSSIRTHSRHSHTPHFNTSFSSSCHSVPSFHRLYSLSIKFLNFNQKWCVFASSSFRVWNLISLVDREKGRKMNILEEWVLFAQECLSCLLAHRLIVYRNEKN